MVSYHQLPSPESRGRAPPTSSHLFNSVDGRALHRVLGTQAWAAEKASTP